MSADRAAICGACGDAGGRGEPCEECWAVGPPRRFARPIPYSIALLFGLKNHDEPNTKGKREHPWVRK